jgi:hypothetical protein
LHRRKGVLKTTPLGSDLDDLDLDPMVDPMVYPMVI